MNQQIKKRVSKHVLIDAELHQTLKLIASARGKTIKALLDWLLSQTLEAGLEESYENQKE